MSGKAGVLTQVVSSGAPQVGAHGPEMAEGEEWGREGGQVFSSPFWCMVEATFTNWALSFKLGFNLMFKLFVNSCVYFSIGTEFDKERFVNYWLPQKLLH